MNAVNTKPNMADVDGFYAELIAAHEGLSREQSETLNASLVLILANHIGDRVALSEAIKLARRAAA